jgi:hypothetical protein
MSFVSLNSRCNDDKKKKMKYNWVEKLRLSAATYRSTCSNVKYPRNAKKHSHAFVIMYIFFNMFYVLYFYLNSKFILFHTYTHFFGVSF